MITLKEKEMTRLRSFLYLDNYKMYSFSSQLFEGLTEYIVKSQSEKKQVNETQKGPFNSGRVLADIIEKDTSSTEKKFLHDYSYNLFEDALIKQNRVLEIDKNSIINSIDQIKNYSFIKVTGRVVFNDIKQIENTIKNFNTIGEALGYVSLKDEYTNEIKDLKDQINSIQDRNQKLKVY